ncbi:sensor histidine kinase [Streptomyces sp. MS2.AVA.5]|uniref:ATP-binding protein n=1 Tax=Streptomyces achmelvichensis TaxID=3134111 RepID=A0ACC6Q520_9ACTN
MSQLRAPAARPDRREGGRHGRSAARSASPAGRQHSAPSSPETRIRPQLLRTAVLPTLVAALSGAAAVIFTIRSATPQPSGGLWVVLTGSAALAIAAVAAAALGADRMARSVLDRCAALRRTTTRSQADLRAVVERLRRGEGPPAPRPALPAAQRGDEFDLLTHELGRSHEAAVTAVVQASRLSSSVGNEQKVEVFVNLARRLQSLVHREIQLLDELENEVEDPELLKGLFHVDHLATRIRRHAENLAVLGGAISRRQWSNPVTMTEVLRSAIAEVEQYPRVKLVPPIDGTLRGHAVADVIHLLAELVENATLYSAPHTQVLMRAQHVTAGLAVEVEDRGLGMPLGEQTKMNALLADPDQVNVAHLLQDGRIGLFVVSALARRHGIAVRLQSNIYGGVQATLVLPEGLLGTEPGDSSRPRRPPPSPQPPPRPRVAGAAAGRSRPSPRRPRRPRSPGSHSHSMWRHSTSSRRHHNHNSSTNRLRRVTTPRNRSTSRSIRSRPTPHPCPSGPRIPTAPTRPRHPRASAPRDPPRVLPPARRPPRRAPGPPAWCAAPWGGPNCPGGAARNTSFRSSRTPHRPARKTNTPCTTPV